MKKFLKSLFSLLVVLGLVSVAVACEKTEEPEHTHEYSSEWKNDEVNHWKECSCGEVSEKAAHAGGEATYEEKAVCATCGQKYGDVKPIPEPTYSYHVVGGYYGDWNDYTKANEMTEITVDELDEEIASQLLDKEITAVLKLEGRLFDKKGEWTADASINGEVVKFDGGFTIKVVHACYDYADQVTSANMWCPDPHKAKVQNLTPDTLFIPNWVETPAAGEEHLGKWDDNPVVIGGVGEYDVYFVEYAGANSADSPKYAMAVVPTKTNLSYHVVGGYFDDWNNYTDENIMKRISALDLPAEMQKQLLEKEIVGVYQFDGRTFNVGPNWTANANVDGEVLTLNGGYTIKVVKAAYDEEDKVSFAQQWNPDPKTSAVQNLTPDTLYMPKWIETPVEGEEGLGTWADNPVVIGGAGEYTVYFVEYKGANAAESPKYAMGLVQTLELEEPKTTAELIEEEHAELVAGTVTEATTFENVAAKVVALESVENDSEGVDVKVIAQLDELLFALTFSAEDVVGLEVGKEVKFTGTINHEAEAVVIGDYNMEIVFANATVTWAKVGAPTGIYLRGDMNGWGSVDEYELTYNEDGNPEITFVVEVGQGFKVADANWADVNCGYNDELDATLVENADGNIKAKVAIALTATLIDGKVVITRGRSGVYLKGSLNGWADKAEYELRCDDDLNPAITVELAANDEFKVATPDWTTVDLGSTAVETELTDAFDLTAGNIKVVTAGTYVVTIITEVVEEAPVYKLVITAAE